METITFFIPAKALHLSGKSVLLTAAVVKGLDTSGTVVGNVF